MGKMYRITEASLSRVWSHITSHGNIKSWGMISGYRAANAKSENIASNRRMEGDLRSMNLGFFKVEGHWKECQNPEIPWMECPPSKLRDTVEESFFIPNISKDALIRLNKKYEQDAAVYGDKTSPGHAKLLFKNGQTTDIGTFHPDKVAQAQSKIQGHSFVFSPKREDTKLGSLIPSKNVANSKIESALRYDTHHPVYELAQRMINQKTN